MNALLVIVGLVAAASAKDLIVGHEGGTIIFNETETASPAIWRQSKTVSVNATDNEVITRVIVIDNREDKNGEATIVEGGEGHKNVTIELKSPAVFRGFDFDIKVYAKREESIQLPIDGDQQIAQGVLTNDTDINDKQVPKESRDDVVKTSESPLPAPSENGQVATTQGEARAPKDENVPVPPVQTVQQAEGQKETQVTQETQEVNTQQGVQHPGVPQENHQQTRPVWEKREEIINSAPVKGVQREDQQAGQVKMSRASRYAQY